MIFALGSIKTGKFKFEAQFVTTVDDKVILKGRDGTVRTVPVSSLSPPDQAFLIAPNKCLGDAEQHPSAYSHWL